MPAIVGGSDFPFSFSGLTMENEGWVECMHPRGFLFGILVEIIIFMFTTRLTCSAYPSPLLMKQARQAGQGRARLECTSCDAGSVHSLVAPDPSM